MSFKHRPHIQAVAPTTTAFVVSNGNGAVAPKTIQTEAGTDILTEASGTITTES